MRLAAKGPEIESAAVEPIEEIVECVPEEGPVGGGQRCDTAVIGQRRSGALQRSIDWTPSQAAAPERALHREGSYPHASSVRRHYGSWAAGLRAAGARGDRRRYTRLAAPRRRYWSAEQVTAAVKRWAVEHDGEPPSYQCWDPAMARRRGRSDTAEVFYRGEWPHASVAIARHGSWSQVLTAAGFQPRPSGGRHRTGADE